MKKIPCRLYSGTMGWKVVNVETNKTLYTSESEIDCEQYIFARQMRKLENNCCKNRKEW